MNIALGPRMVSGGLEEFHCCGGHLRGPGPDMVDHLLSPKGPVLSVLVQQLGIGTVLTNPVRKKAGTGPGES